MIVQILLFSALGLLVGALLFIWLVGRVRYRIGSRHLKVQVFGVPLRRVSLESIESVSKRRGDGLAEHWWSTLRPKHRLLVVRRKRGLFRNVMITPKNRYVFKTDLERAMRRVAGGAQPGPTPPADGDKEADSEAPGVSESSTRAA